MMLLISRSLLNEILEHCDRVPHREACGLLLGGKGRITAIRPARNISPDPESRFEIDPTLLFDQARRDRAAKGGEGDGVRAIGHYHSHPNGLAEPSAADAAGVTDPTKLWLIVAGRRPTLWRADAPDGLHRCFAPVELVID